MSYQVLARKWRPRCFADMVGQEHILRMLSNALTQKRLHHAYLFTGTRGVGKTTLARILAKCLNCETGVTPTPCGTCAFCLAIDAGQFLDLYEVDAASRTKVEDTRELLDNVLYPPTQGRYKVYLIDEIHMLSTHSFNALLKTLEEPPEHVKFLFATTEPKRLPITILSRCLQFHLKHIPLELIAKRLQYICDIEKIPHDASALALLAKAADGSMRDALSLTDQAIAYGHGAIKQQEVQFMLGSMAQDELYPLMQAIAKQDGQALFTKVAELAEHAPDYMQVLEELISLLHQVALYQIVPLALPNASAIIVDLSQVLSAQDLQLYYQIALLARRDLALAPAPKQGFEMAMLRMLAFHSGQVASNTTNANMPLAATAPSSTLAPIAQPALATASTESALQIEGACPNAAAEHTVTQTLHATPEWLTMLPKLGLSGMAYALASNCAMVSMEENKIELALTPNHQPMLNPKSQERIHEAIERLLNKKIQLTISVTKEALTTPTKIATQEKDARLKTAKETVMQDPHVQQLIEMYDATVEVSLLS